eukprot:CAMPEP_0197866032 /NCGR_PEP_ID=MMETSP1438-20131217/43988_1 /TAXON_ID=1461541 /ORGANISM="Pterosperma sp., Strain CCMP1384" /LENGTH=673 /DNA_ID=CAMNT_0043484563 /DNA_START=164 /DNA_END=2185 /DNA_ORIENTATION=-
MSPLKCFLAGLLLSIALPQVQPVSIPLTLGSQQLNLVLEDWEDPGTVIKGMYEELEQRLAREIETARNKPADLEVPVVVDGETMVLKYHKNENITTTVANFVKTKGLPDEAVEALNEEVTQRALDAGVLPIFEHRFRYGEQQFMFPVYVGKNAEEEIEKFAVENLIPAEVFPRLKENLKEALTAAGLIPIASYDFQFGDQVLNFSIRSGDNVAEKIADFGEKYGLNEDQLAAVTAEIRKKLVRSGHIPMREFPISMTAGEETKEFSIPLFSGDDVGTAVARFATRYNLPEDLQKQITEQLAARAQQEGILPLVQFPLKVHGEDAVLPIFSDTNVQEAIVRFGESHQLPEGDVAALQKAVTNELQDLGIAPVAEYTIDIDGKATLLPVYRGDNIEERVVKFGEANGVPQDQLPLLFQEIQNRLETEKVRVTPVAEMQVSHGGQPRVLRIYPGDTVKEVVEAFVEQHGIPADAIPSLIGEVSNNLVTQKVIPKVQIPVNIDGDQQTLALFEGDTALDAATAFVKTHSLDEKLIPDFVEHTEARMKRLRLMPALTLEVQYDGNPVTLELFEGQLIDDAVANLMVRNSMPEDLRATLVTEVERRAIAASILPFTSIPIQIDEKDHQLPLFVGQNVTQAVYDFGSKHELADETMPQLLQAVQNQLKELLNQVDQEKEA